MSRTLKAFTLALPAVSMLLSIHCGGMNTAPIILSQPLNQKAAVGGSATFSVQAFASPAPTYQWLRDGQAIPGATQSSYTLAAVKASDHGATFSVQVSSPGGNVLSQAATLSVEAVETETQTFTITFVNDEGGSLEGALVQTVKAGGSTTAVVAKPNTGFDFNFWYGEGSKPRRDANLVITGVKQNITLRASFASKGTSEIGKVGHDIVGIDSKGVSVALSDYLGSVVIMDLAAGWCSTCNKMATSFEALHKRVAPKGIQCLTVLTQNEDSQTSQQADLQAWIDRYGSTMRLQNDLAGGIKGPANQCYVQAHGSYPAFAVLDRQFKVQYIAGDYLEAEKVALKLIGE